MTFLRKTLFSLAFVFVGAVSSPAAEYSFSVPKLDMQVFVNPDASLRIVYDITFRNNPRAHPIDVVDIGTPTDRYRLDNVSASSDGARLTDIRESEYVDPGFEVHMRAKTIRPGATGALHVEFTMPDLVFQDTTREDYASLRITPTWFGEKYVRGLTHIKVAIHLPEGVKPDEALHQGLPFSRKALFQDRTVVVWDWPAERLTGPHLVGVSFPKRGMDRVVTQTAVDLLIKWFSQSTQARVTLGVVFLIGFGFVFFRFSGGTGISVYVVLSALACWLFYVSPGWHLAIMPMLLILVGVNEWFLTRRKLRYMPPIAQVEGGGIKRGLTAPEAASLLEMPVGKVLSLVIFGLLKKGVLRQVQSDPLMVELDAPFRAKDKKEASHQFFRAAAQKRGVALHKYEYPFLFLIGSNPGKPVKELNFGVALKKLFERTASRMKGFDLSETKSYYRSIVRRATEQAKAIGDIPQREKVLDRHFEWILLDDDYPNVFPRPYRPIWMRGGHVFPHGTSSAAPASPSIPGQTSFGDVAASFTGWTENTMGSLASSIAPGSLNVEKPGGGFLDLSGADRLTGDFFEALGDAGSGGGGGGGCACAGCACACACAGGGR